MSTTSIPRTRRVTISQRKVANVGADYEREFVDLQVVVETDDGPRVGTIESVCVTGVVVRFPDGRWCRRSLDLQVVVPSETVRVLVAVDVPVEYAADRADLTASIAVRLIGEAGYLNDGTPILPRSVTTAIVDDDSDLDVARLAGIYAVGADL